MPQDWMNYVVPSASAQRQSAAFLEPWSLRLFRKFFNFRRLHWLHKLYNVFCRSPPFHSMFAKARHARNDAPPWLRPLWVCLSQMNLLCFWNETCSFRIGSAILSWERTKEIEGETFLLILLIMLRNNTVSAVYMCQTHQCGAEITAAQRSKGQEDSFWKSM